MGRMWLGKERTWKLERQRMVQKDGDDGWGWIGTDVRAGWQRKGMTTEKSEGVGNECG